MSTTRGTGVIFLKIPDYYNNMSTTKPAIKKTFVNNPFEQIKEFTSDTARKAPQEIINTFIPGSEMWGSPTPKPEEVPGGPNFSPVDFEKLQSQYQQQDSPDIDKVRQQLLGLQGGSTANQAPQISAEQLHQQRHNQVKREEEQQYLRTKHEEEEEIRKEELEKQQEEQAEAEAAEAAQQQSSPQGKVRKNVLGGGHKKSNMDLPPEVRHERKGGAGKH